MSAGDKELSFWDHLDDLRGVLLKIGITVATAAILLFIFMKPIFNNIILAPCRGDFALYRLLDSMGHHDGSMWWPQLGGAGFSVNLINIELASQFFTHMTLSCWLAFVLTFPIIIYLLWTFVKPGLYPHERRGAVRAFAFGNLMFYAGVVTGYFLVFPLTLRFLADYQLSEQIPNTITLTSYIDNFLVIMLLMGAVFELPLLAWLLGKMGLLTRAFFGKYRRHAIVALLLLAAVITPTGDPFTLFMVFLPIYLLWEGSALIVPTTSGTNKISA